MAACQIAGHADSYGLGIRIGFYLQWFGMIITSWLLESDALNLKFLNGLTIAATSIGLVLNLGSFQPAEIYVVLQLVCGTLYFLVPVYLWRLLTCCRPWWDTERWNRVRMGWLFKTGMGLMFGLLLGLQIWFWCTGVHDRPTGTDTRCQQYGFMFGQVQLTNPGETTVNIIIDITILTVGTWKCAELVGAFEECRWYRRRKRRRWSIAKDHIESLQQLRTIFDVVVAAILITAVELAIAWNDISGVNDLSTAAQLIPPIISGAYLLGSIYAWLSEPPPEDQDHLTEFPYFTSGSGGSGTCPIASDGGAGGQPRPSMVYMGSSRDWAAGRRHQPRHHRRRDRTRRSVRWDPSPLGYDAQGVMGYPEMTGAAGPPPPHDPASAAAASGHRATVEDAPDEIYAAEPGAAGMVAADAAPPQVPPAAA